MVSRESIHLVTDWPFSGRSAAPLQPNADVDPTRVDLSRPNSVPVGGAAKRCLDVVLATTMLIVLSPIMIAVAALIKITLGGPVFFVHPRIGYGGRVFRCWKFRTMVVNGDETLRRYFLKHPSLLEEWRKTQKLRFDPRITPLGRMLRVSSLDELPQLVNILKGDMSCVGPRPVVAAELERYGDQAANYVSARPGLTGLWQVSGRSTCTYDQRVALDCAYLSNWSLRRDLAILLKTIPAVMKSDGAV